MYPLKEKTCKTHVPANIALFFISNDEPGAVSWQEN